MEPENRRMEKQGIEEENTVGIGDEEGGREAREEEKGRRKKGK